MEKKKVKKVIVYTLCALISAVVGFGVYVHIKIQTPQKPELKEWPNDNPEWRNAAYTNRVLTHYRLTDKVCALSHWQLCSYTDTIVKFDIYRLYYTCVFTFFQDSITENKIIYYHQDRDSVTLYSYIKADVNQYTMFTNMTSDRMDSLLRDTITAVGVYTSENGIIKMPIRPEATEQLKERYELIKQHFEHANL